MKLDDGQKQAFSMVHQGGAAVLKAFGAGGLADTLADFETQQGLLPGAPQDSAVTPSPQTVVDAPEYVVIVRAAQPPQVMSRVAHAALSGGVRFAGTGYRKGSGLSSKKFSFGFQNPSHVTVSLSDGTQIGVDDAAQVVFLGGRESAVKTSIHGFEKESTMLDEDETDSMNDADLGPERPTAEEELLERAGHADRVVGGGPAAKRGILAAIASLFRPSAVVVKSHSMHGCDVLGAQPIKKAPKVAPKGASFRPVVPAPKKSILPGSKLTRPAIVKSAVETHKSLSAKLKAAAKTLSKPSVHAVLGAAGPIKLPANLTPKQKKALDKYNAAAKKAASKDAAARKSFKDATSKVATLAKHIHATAGKHVASKKGQTVMHGVGSAAMSHGDWDEILGETASAALSHGDWDEIVGDSDANGVAPGEPGYNPATDPSSSSYDPTQDPFSAQYAGGGSTSTGVDPLLNPDVQQTISEQQSTPQALDKPCRKVLDGIVYDGSNGWPRYAFGSYSYFFGPKRGNSDRKPEEDGMWGFVWGWDHANPPNDNMSPRWILRHGNDRFGTDNWDDYTHDPSLGTPGDASIIATLSTQGYKQQGGGGGDGFDNSKFSSYSGPKYGPLIGNPNGDFAKLRWADDDHKWFWFPSEAPAWATVDLKNEQMLAKQAADQAAAAAAKADADAKAKAQADADAQTAQQDLQNSLAESAAVSQANVAQTQLNVQQQQLAQKQAEFDEQQYEQQAQAGPDVGPGAPDDGGDSAEVPSSDESDYGSAISPYGDSIDNANAYMDNLTE